MSEEEYQTDVSDNDSVQEEEQTRLPSRTLQRKQANQRTKPRNTVKSHSATNNRRVLTEHNLNDLIDLIRQQQDDLMSLQSNTSTTKKKVNNPEKNKQRSRPIKEEEPTQKKTYQKRPATNKTSVIGKTIGTKLEVYEGRAERTAGGLYKPHLVVNSKGMIVSKLKSENAKRNFHGK